MSTENTVREAAPVNTFARPPRIILHVGKGLGRFQDLPEKEARAQLEKLAWKGNLAALSSEAYRDSSPRMLICPEAMRNESDAAVTVMKTFRETRKWGGSMLTVVTFSQNLVSAIIDALVQVNFHEELAVCAHSEKEGEISVHRLNADGVLQDWPYGCLQALLDEDELAPMDFAKLRWEVNLIEGRK